MKRYLAILAFAAALLMPAAQADPGNSQGKGQGQPDSLGKDRIKGNDRD